MLKMKNFLFSTLVLVAMVLVGCNNEPTPDTPTGPAKFTLESTSLEVAAEGGEYAISYTIENPVANGIVTAIPKNNWVTLTDTQNGAIKFTVESNTGIAARETDIAVAYSGVEERVLITINQPSVDGELFALTNVTTTVSTITLDITPRDKEVPYICRVQTVEDCEAFDQYDDYKLFTRDFGMMQNEASTLGQSASHYVKSLAKTGDVKGYTLEGLTPNVPYVVYCYHIDFDTMYYVGDVFRLEVRTASPEMKDITFDMEFDINGANVEQSIIPSNNNVYYYYAHMSVDDFYAWYGPDASFEESFEDKWNKVVLVQGTWGYDLYTIIKNNCVKGEFNYTYTDLLANTEYVFYAVAVDETTGYVASVPYYEIITTGSVAQSDMTIDISVTNITSNTATLSFTPSTTADTYGCSYVTKDEWLSYGDNDAQRIYSITTRHSLYERNEPASFELTDLSASTDYVAFALGLTNGNATTGVFYKEFSTL